MIPPYRLLVNRDLPLPERGCGSKVPHSTRAEARSFARQGRRANGALRPYRCRWCPGWHLGHRGSRKERFHRRRLGANMIALVRAAESLAEWQDRAA